MTENEENKNTFMNDERCALLFKTIEILLRDYMSLLEVVSTFSNSKEKIESHYSTTAEVVEFLALLNKSENKETH